MRKSIIAATLAMTVGVAGAQAGGGYADNTQYVAPTTTTAPAATNAPVSGSVVLTDVPAGHWARDAVEAIVEAGLIQGFPDGTFRGNENLTRYQAAMIFHRLLQSGALSGSDISDEDLLVITRGMQEVSTELAAISSRLTDVERLTVEQQARIDAIEAAIKGMDTGDSSALVARIDALEARIAQLEGTTTAPAPVTPAPDAPTTGGDIVIGDPVVTPVTPAGNMYAGIGGGYYPINSQFVGNTDYQCLSPFVSARTDVNDPAADGAGRVNYCGSLLGTVGAQNLYGPVGGRVNVEYIPGRDNAIAADVNATVGTDLGLVQPYAGAGVGVVYGKDRPNTDGTTAQQSATDIYANLLGGADFKVTPNVGLFAEANGKYYFSSNTTVAQGVTGVTAGSTDSNTGGFGYGARAGVKLFF
ncbi:SLH family protein [Deinococcus piscis]|uniref:SLH family protein n=1 Tax=Deinococcus piscis TaxID=394230 RepID=A0ABQ3K053_9DEIO|nr:S-layer homology domain-containing protein [Deinococcus piscis]GHF98104.1 SLH family protein [Deinococcus piscis]